MIENEEEKKSNEKFLEYMTEHSNGDCAADVFKRAETPFQKQLAIELFKNEKEHELMKRDVTHVKRIVWAIFLVVAVTAVANFASSYILPLI